MAGGADRKHAILPCRSGGFDEATTAALESHVRSVPKDGPVAQLGARLNGIQEVTGSIPVRSTIPPFSRSWSDLPVLHACCGSLRPPLALPDPGQVHLPHPVNSKGLNARTKPGVGTGSARAACGRAAQPQVGPAFAAIFRDVEERRLRRAPVAHSVRGSQEAWPKHPSKRGIDPDQARGIREPHSPTSNGASLVPSP
jgi:hypothetical protein